MLWWYPKGYIQNKMVFGSHKFGQSELMVVNCCLCSRYQKNRKPPLYDATNNVADIPIGKYTQERLSLYTDKEITAS